MATDFKDLVSRAERRTRKRNRKPFVLNIEGDEPISVKYPDAIKSIEYERAQTVYDQLRILTGSDFARILQLFEGEDISVVQLFITEMWDFWADDSHEVPGGKED